MSTTDVKASVIIPTLNGGAEFAQCLAMVFKQEIGAPFEVIVIDSGSTDQTLDIARRLPVRLYTIAQKDFSHGGTRQFGVELASGEYVVFLTQDAIPADEQWLPALVGTLDFDGSVAGVYSRQLPKPECDPISRMRLSNWLAGSAERRVAQITSRAAYDALSPWDRCLFINFDDVSSCVRKAVLEELPYRKVAFGEDLDWSRRVLEAGYKIVYEPASQVYHSHPTSVMANYRRAYVDHKTMKELLNVEFHSQFFPSASRFVLDASRQQIKADWAAIRRSDLGVLRQVKWMLSAVPMEVLEKVGCVQGARSAKAACDNRSRKRIVLVTHDFPPDHCGGVAVYTYTLAKELSKRHDVHVFYRKWDGTRLDYSVHTQAYDGLPVTIVHNNFAANGNGLMLYKDGGVDEVFRRFLSQRRPDVVHFQFLGTGLSTGMVRVAKELGIPTVLTLNDYWFMCPRGQMVNSRWQLCSQVVEETCARCVTGPHTPLADLDEPQRGHASIDLLAEAAFQSVAVRAPDPNFVRLGELTVCGRSKRTLIEHPPAEVRYRVVLPKAATLRFALALPEDTWEYCDGEGVRFEVGAATSNSEERALFSRYLDPKHVTGDRGWHRCAVDLSPFGGETVPLIFRTAPGPKGDISYCTAGWGDLRIDVEDEGMPALGVVGVSPPRDRLRELLRRGFRAVADNGVSPTGVRRIAAKAYAAVAPRTAALKEVRRRVRTMRGLLSDVDLLISPSKFLRQMYMGFGVPADKISYSDYGMNRVHAPRSRPTPPGKLTFGYIGTLMPTKGVHVLIDAFLKLPEGRAELRIYGPAPNKYHLGYLRMLEQKTGSRNDIALLGEYKMEAIGDILCEVDAVVVPSIWHENSPLTIHEAFLAGVPVITSNIGGMAELVSDGVNGLHFKVGDAEDLSSKLMMLIENPAMATELSAHVPTIKSIEENAAELEAMYDELIAAKQTAA